MANTIIPCAIVIILMWASGELAHILARIIEVLR